MLVSGILLIASGVIFNISTNESSITLIVLTSLVFASSLLLTVISQPKLNTFYGPLIFPVGDQIQIHWWTRKPVKTQLSINGQVVESNNEASCFHNYHVSNSSFQASVVDPHTNTAHSISYDPPEIITDFIVTSDHHGNSKYSSRLGADYQLHLIGGDISDFGTPGEFCKTFKNFHTRPIIMAIGNHDTRGDIDHIINRQTYYQKFGSIGVFVLYVFQRPTYIHDSALISSVFSWLRQAIATDDKHKFIIVHAPVYSTGLFGSTKLFTTQMEQFLDEHENERIRAVFQGHDHVFCSFKRKNVYLMTNATCGGDLVSPRRRKFDQTRWRQKELHGPLESNNDRRIGWEHHLDSWLIRSKTEVHIGDKITYKIRDLDTMQIKATYEQEID
ncbi:Alkaline_phosphatase [Hexamita inflata]|uniref:Alkaline phosphatase n=1 Tax=Hexamita inflata TaxID=28002 RepID=A0AA86NYV4_9EUKA|nr:Alkaline phosphatase [Hexamita inflata]